jgi:hypothetical protein
MMDDTRSRDDDKLVAAVKAKLSLAATEERQLSTPAARSRHMREFWHSLPADESRRVDALRAQARLSRLAVRHDAGQAS